MKRIWNAFVQNWKQQPLISRISLLVSFIVLMISIFDGR